MSENPQEQSEAKLLAYIEGELDEASRAEIERYLTGNPKHRRLLAELSAGRDQLRRLPRESAPPELFDGFQAQLERQLLLQPAADINPQTGNFRLNRWGQIRAAAAAVVLASGLGVIVYTAMPKGSQQGRTPVALQTTPPTDKPATDVGTNGKRDADSAKDKSDNKTNRLREAEGDSVADRRADESPRKERVPADATAFRALALATPQERAAVDFARGLDGVRLALAAETESVSLRKAANGTPIAPPRMPVPRPAPGMMPLAVPAEGSRDGGTADRNAGAQATETAPPPRPDTARSLAKGDAASPADLTGGVGNVAARPPAARAPATPAPGGLAPAALQQPALAAAEPANPGASHDKQRHRGTPSAADPLKAEPLYVVVATADADVIDARLSFALADAGLSERSRSVFGPADAQPVREMRRGMMPKPSAEPDMGGADASPQSLPTQATLPPAITPLPATPMTADTRPAMSVAAAGTRPGAFAANGTAVAQGGLPPGSPEVNESAAINSAQPFNAPQQTDVRRVLVLKQVPRAQAAALIARLNQPDAEQIASPYIVGPGPIELASGIEEKRSEAAAPTTTPAVVMPGAVAAGPADTGIAAAGAAPAVTPDGVAANRDNLASRPMAAARKPAAGSVDVALGSPQVPVAPATQPAAAPPAAASTQPAEGQTDLADRMEESGDPATRRPAATRLAEPADLIRPGDAVVVHYTHIRAAVGSVPPPVTVKPDGTILIAGHGSFRIAGLTPQQATEQLNGDFRRQQQNRSVEIRRVPPADAPTAGPAGPRPTRVFGSSIEFAKFAAPTTQPELIDVVIVVRQSSAKAKS